jgi:Na+/H+-dicarboxylate symporter
MSEREITQDTIYGAICGYLLLALCWALVFSLIETMVPGSFAVLVTPAGDQERVASLMFYYSFTSLTTLGYGDIVPISPVTRSFSTLEAVMGQLYLTVLVARLVGLHISRRPHD